MSASGDKIKVFENFLSESDFQKIKNVLTDCNFPWYKSPIITNPDERIPSEEFNLQFSHFFYVDYSPVSENINIIAFN